MDKKRLRLDEIEKKNPFSVPEGYFENLPQLIQAKIPPVTEKEPIIVKSWNWQLTFSSIAAMLVIAVLFWVTLPKMQGNLGNEPLSGISDNSIIEYLEEQNISYYDLSEHQVVQSAFESDSTIMNYLDGMDEDLLIKQLEETSSINLEKI